MDRSQEKAKGWCCLRVDDFCASNYSSCDVGPIYFISYYQGAVNYPVSIKN